MTFEFNWKTVLAMGAVGFLGYGIISIPDLVAVVQAVCR